MTEAEGGQLQQLLAAQGAYQKAVTNPEVEAKTRAFYDQWPQAVATTTAAMQSLEREGRTDNPYYQAALPPRPVGTARGGPPPPPPPTKKGGGGGGDGAAGGT